MSSLGRLLSTGAWLASSALDHRRFLRALSRPAHVQAATLRRLVRRNRDCAFGRAHGFDRIDDVAAFRRRVPVRDYDEHEPWLGRALAGERSVIAAEPLLMAERTSGSTRANKLIPYTGSLRGEFARAVAPWVVDTFLRHPDLLGTSSYWSVSQAARQGERTASGLPIGFDDDTAYFAPLERWALSNLLAVSPAVARAPDLASWREQTCVGLLRARELGLISVWSPTFLTLLMDAIDAGLSRLCTQLPTERAREVLQNVERQGRVTGRALWPRLTVISCWADGPSADYVAELRARFPGVAIEPKGLLATEGVVSTSCGVGPGAPVAITSHFLEFLPLEGGAPLLAHELRVGARYSPLLTTGGGLYRYHLKDVVECVGHDALVPRVRFVEKLERVSDQCGEKLHASFVRDALEAVRAELGVSYRFALLAPHRAAPPRYRLYVEAVSPNGRATSLAARLEERLMASHHYAYCRRLGQLDALDVVPIRNGAETFQRTLRARGMRAGDIKPTCLDGDTQWSGRFEALDPENASP